MGLDLLRETELALLNAPFEEDGWRRAVEMVARATGGSAANLVGFGGPLHLSFNLFVGEHADRAERYTDEPQLWGPANWRVNTTGDILAVRHEPHYAVYRHRADTSDYDDAVSDVDIQFGCQSVLLSDEQTFLGIAIMRGRRQGPCDDLVLRRFERLLRPIQRAVRLQLALDGEAAEVMLGDLGQVDSAVVLLDRYGCVGAMSPAIEPLTEKGGPIRLSGLTLELRNRAENRELQNALASLLRAEPGPADAWVRQMLIGRSPEQSVGNWTLSLARLPRREHGLGFEPQIAITVQQVGGVAAPAATAG